MYFGAEWQKNTNDFILWGFFWLFSLFIYLYFVVKTHLFWLLADKTFRVKVPL